LCLLQRLFDLIYAADVGIDQKRRAVRASDDPEIRRAVITDHGKSALT
jgi:hypothetical protein